MKLEISRGFIKVLVGSRSVTIQGEMFFPGDAKIGFLLYKESLKYWDDPYASEVVSEDRVADIINFIGSEFLSGGHTLEIEP